MATISELIVAIKADTTGLDKGLKDTESKLGSAGDKAKTFGQKWDDMKPQLLMAAGMVAAIGAAALKTAQDFAEAELAARRLDFAGRLAGSKQAAEEITELAGAIQDLTGQSDDLVKQLGAEELAKGRSVEQTKELIKVAVDLASATGVDLQTAVKQLSDTYSGEAGRISKVIPALKDLTKEQLKNGEGVKLIAQYYRGFADELQDSTSVALNRAGQYAGDLSELMGSFFAPNVKKVADGFSGMAKGLINTVGSIQAWSDEMTDANVAFNASLGHQESMAIMQSKLEKSYQLSRNALDKYRQSLKDSSKEELDAAKVAMQAAIARSRHLPLLAAQFQKALGEIEKAIAERADAETKELERLRAERQREIDDFLDKQDQMLKAGVITAKEYYNAKINYQEKLINELKTSEKALTADQLAEIKKRQGYVASYHEALKRLEEGSTEAIERAIDDRNEISEDAAEERQKNLEYNLDLALESEIRKLDEEIRLEEEAAKERERIQREYWDSVGKMASAGFTVASALNEAFSLGLGDALKKAESVAGNVTKLLASGGMDITAWAGLVADAIGLIGDAFDALSGEEARKAEEARRKEAKAIEDAARDRLATKIELLERERIEEISKAIATGAQTRDIEIYYARAIARAKLEANESILAEQRRIESESDRIRRESYQKALSINSNLTTALAKAEEDRAKLAGNWVLKLTNRSAWDAAMSGIETTITDLRDRLQTAANDIAEAEIEALEMSLALFGDRAESASKGLAATIVDGFKEGQTEEEIKAGIFELFQNMAIEAAVMAAGIGDRFEGIGASLAQALADGVVSSQELGSLTEAVDKLYDDASKAVDAAMAVFGGTPTQRRLIEENTKAMEETAEEQVKIAKKLAEEQAKILEDQVKEQERFVSSISSSLSKSFVEGFQKGESEEEIKGAIFEMLQNMAVQAAIMASGIGNRFEEIGANIAQALTDGFIDNAELANIEGQIDRLYASANQVIGATMGAFRTEGNATAFGSSTVNVTINSPTAVNPSEAAAIIANTARNLSFEGVL